MAGRAALGMWDVDRMDERATQEDFPKEVSTDLQWPCNCQAWRDVLEEASEARQRVLA